MAQLSGQVRRRHSPTIGDRRRHQRHLHRGHLQLTLPEGSLDQQLGRPFGVRVLDPLGDRQVEWDGPLEPKPSGVVAQNMALWMRQVQSMDRRPAGRRRATR